LVDFLIRWAQPISIALIEPRRSVANHLRADIGVVQ
jgi:hypothetical protein